MLANSKTVLIVEDEEMISAFIAAVLEEQGFRVLQASTSDEAERLWARESGAIDLMLSDYILPGRSGVDLATSMIQSNPALKVVFMSGLDEEHFRPAAALRDAPVMRKPFSCGAIEEMTVRLFGARRLSGTPSSAGAF